MSVVISIISMLIILSVLTVVHELGHYTAARIFKVKIKEFSVFMGPLLWSRKSKKTGIQYSVRALPLGGYCAFEDEDKEDVEGTLNAQKWYKRAIILVSGVLMNVVLAFLIAIIILGITGYEKETLSTVPEFTPAYVCGIEAGDELVGIDGHNVTTTTDYNMYSYVIKDQNDAEDIMDSHYSLEYEKPDGRRFLYDIRKHAEYDVVYDKGGNISSYVLKSYSYTADVTSDTLSDTCGKYVFSSELKEIKDDTVIVCLSYSKDGKIIEKFDEKEVPASSVNTFGGTYFDYTTGKNPVKIIGHSGKYLVSMVKTVVVSIKWIFTGEVGVDALSGPVGLTSVVDDVVTADYLTIGDKIMTLLNMAALISANLAVFNLIPFPGLDGFHLLLIVIELIRGGKKVPAEKQGLISGIGLGLLILLSVFIMFSDIFKLVG